MNKLLRIIKVILGIILIVIGFLLVVAGISEQEARAAIVIGLIFMGLGVLLFRKKKAYPKKKIESILSKTQKEQPESIKQPHERKYRDSIITPTNVISKEKGRMNILDIFRISEIKKENETIKNENTNLQAIINEIGARDAIAVKNKIAEFQETEKNLANSCAEARRTIETLQAEIRQKHKEIIVLDENIMLETFALYKPKFKFLTSNEYKIRLDAIRDNQKAQIKNNIAITANESWTVRGSVSEGKKLVNDMKKLLLRSFNNECDYCVDNVKFNNLEAGEKRIEKSYEQCNKLGRIMEAEISSSYKKLKYDELYLAYEYQRKKEEEKEELKRAREEQREQQKLEREIREAREKIAKEKKHFVAAIKEFEEKLTNATDEKERELIEKNLAEAKGQLADLDKEEKVIDYREQNAKAGYVYVISNVGAFGEGVYKIGMTRRLEPMERVDELGDASVPFSFDVHALIFSDNAPALETKLHEHFYKNRINKVNDRKEFFKADINEIEKVIKENYEKIVDVVKEAPAEQYRESLLL
jgi:hypothetical protein